MKQPLKEIMRVLGGLVIIVTFWVAVTVLIGGLAGPDVLNAGGMGGTPLGALVLFLSISGLGIGTVIAARVTHGWSFLDLFGPLGAIIWLAPRALAVAGGFAAVAVVLTLNLDESSRQMSVALWLSYLPIALMVLLIQTLAEELAFRAYALKALRYLGLAPTVVIVATSAVFALLHFNPEATATGHIFGFLIIFTIAATAADLTLRSGSLVSAWMIHFVNNVAAALFVAPEGYLSGFSLWVTPITTMTDIPVSAALMEIGRTLLIWHLIRRGIPKPP
jgi:uncharacterized protein